MRIIKTVAILCTLLAAVSAIGDEGFPIEYLQGEWQSSDYQCTRMHTETIRIQVQENYLDATKIDADGDRCVPTGSRSFAGNLPLFIKPGESHAITFTTGNTVGPSCCRSPGYLRLNNADEFLACGDQACTQGVLRFKRLNAGSGL